MAFDRSSNITFQICKGMLGIVLKQDYYAVALALSS